MGIWISWLARMILMVFGGGLTAIGVTGDAAKSWAQTTAEIVFGIGLTLGSMAWSWWIKRGHVSDGKILDNYDRAGIDGTARLPLLLPLGLALLLAGGCSSTPMRTYSDSLTVYNSTMSVLITGVKAGYIPKDVARTYIEPARATAATALDQMREAALAGRDVGFWDALKVFNAAIEQLIKVQITHQNKETADAKCPDYRLWFNPTWIGHHRANQERQCGRSGFDRCRIGLDCYRRASA